MVASKPKKKTVKQLKKRADEVFSQYIRQKYADPHTGQTACITCGTVRHWKELQCGHYEKRSANSLRFDPANAHPQCVGCNVFKSGNYPRYAQFMVKTYGQSVLEELAEKSKEIKQFRVPDLETIISEYQAKIEGLQNPA